MSSRQNLLVIALAAAVVACDKPAPAPPPAMVSRDSSLYKRLGGYDALAAVTDDFLQRLHSDTTVMAFFGGIDSTGMAHIRQMVVDQLCAASGGPCIYVGKSMKESHATLDITADAFDKFVAHFKETLVAFKVPEREQGEVLGALGSMRGDVVK